MDLSLKTMLTMIKSSTGCYALIRCFKYLNGQYDCRRCGGTNERKQKNESITICADCNKIESLTANTIFHRHHKALTELFPVIFKVILNKGQSANSVARELKMWYSTVYEWMEKVRTYFPILFSPENTQEVHYSHLLKVLFRRTKESTPECASGCRLAHHPEAENAGKNGLIQPPNGKEVESIDHACAAGQDVAYPIDVNSVEETVDYLRQLFHPGVSLKHAPGYTAQAHYHLTDDKKNVLTGVRRFLTACCQSAPQEIERSTFLVLPLLTPY